MQYSLAICENLFLSSNSHLKTPSVLNSYQFTYKQTPDTKYNWLSFIHTKRTFNWKILTHLFFLGSCSLEFYCKGWTGQHSKTGNGVFRGGFSTGNQCLLHSICACMGMNRAHLKAYWSRVFEHKNTEITDILWSHLAKKLTLKKLDSFFGNRKIGESTLLLFCSQLLLGKQ